MQPRLVDLHTHSWISDGSDSPTELVKKGAAAGLAAMALTDHDTVAGLDEAVETGKRLGLEVIRGCELSVNSPYGEVHILGLWLPADASGLSQALGDLRAARTQRNHKIVERLNGLGVALTYDEVLAVAGGESVGRPHIARVMLSKGYGESLDNIFRQYLNRGGAAFVPKTVLEPQDGVALLANQGATVAVAHPMLLRAPRDWLETFMADLRPHGLSAIEAWHSEHSPLDERYCADLASRLGLGLTGGSDYHGLAKPRVRLGRGKGALRVTTAFLDRLKDQRRAKGLPL